MTLELEAAMRRSRSSLGGVRIIETDGSTNLRSSFAVVLFAEPCSPSRMRIGYGPFDRYAVTSHARQSIQLFSEPRLRNFRSMVTWPPIEGNGNALMLF